MAHFSSALKLTDLDDFITPSQACINPEVIKKTTQAQDRRVEISAEGVAEEVDTFGARTVLKPAKISLADCLACSGCVTSAEAVLISAQSADEFLENLQSEKKRAVTVVTVAPQSLASLAVSCGMPMDQAFRRLVGFLRSLGVDHVFDVSVGRELALLRISDEFVERYEKQTLPLPLLTSACPGWVCYAEKTLGEYIIPHMSDAKSPQQVMGSLVKEHFCAKLHLRPDQVFHATIMPCYDKKLEASRADFVDEATGVRHVDVVLATSEIAELLERGGRPLAAFDEVALDRLAFCSALRDDGRLHGRAGVSGGYADYVFQQAAQRRFGIVAAAEWTPLRNSDAREATLSVDGQVKLRFAQVYGFRNIQNLVRRIKQGKSNYHFVEVMACPSGCINGGGQIRAAPTDVPLDHLRRVVEEYTRATQSREPAESDVAHALVGEWLHGGLETPQAVRTLRTHYKPVDKLLNPLTIKW